MPAKESGPSVKKKGRRARLLVLVLVLALLAGLGYGAYWSVDTVRASFPQTTGSLKVPGLTGTVEVKRDEHGIPQLYADSDEDLFRAQGFVQAQDRFWEMDVRRHMTSGRLSEMFGSGRSRPTPSCAPSAGARSRRRSTTRSSRPRRRRTSRPTPTGSTRG